MDLQPKHTLAKRIIPCLDVKDGQTVKGVNFEGLRQAGNPVELALRYAQQGADELVLLDITATIEGRGTFIKTVEQVASQLHIPFTVGGGIRSVEDVSRMLAAGADKVSVNSAAIKNPDLIAELAARFGSQCVVVAIDTRATPEGHFVFSSGGRIQEPLKTLDWAQECVRLGAGEILLTSMDADGTKAGFDLPITRAVSQLVNVPVIASGGAGNQAHFLEVFNEGAADAGLAASIFHFGEVSLPSLKQYLKAQGLNIRI